MDTLKYMSISYTIRQKIKEFAACDSGLVFVEFAMSFFVLLILFAASLELTRYVLIVQNMEKTASTIVTSVSQIDPTKITTGASVTSIIDATLAAVPSMMSPYGTKPTETIMISDVFYNATPPVSTTVRWQYCGGGTLSGVSSKIGKAGGSADLSQFSGFSIINPTDPTSNQEILVTEIYYKYNPILANLGFIGISVPLYRSSLFSLNPALGSTTPAGSPCP